MIIDQVMDNKDTAPDILERLKIDTSDLPPLKPRQRAFLNHLFNDKSVTDAYRLAGYKTKHAAKASHRLVNNPPIDIYVELCRKKTQPIATYAQKIEKLWEMVEKAPSDIALKAIAELNKMQGDIAPTQTQSTMVNISTTATLEDIRNARLEYKKDK